MTRLLTPTSILLTVILLAVNIPALAVDRTFQIEVENRTPILSSTAALIKSLH